MGALRDFQAGLRDRLTSVLSKAHREKQSAVLEELTEHLVDQSILQGEKTEEVETLVQRRMAAPEIESMLLSSFELMMQAQNCASRAAIAKLTAKYFNAGKPADRIFFRCGGLLREIDPEELRQVLDFLRLIDSHFSDAPAVIVAQRATQHERKRSLSIYTFNQSGEASKQDFASIDIDERLMDGFRLLKSFGFGEDMPDVENLPSGPSAIRLGRNHIAQARQLVSLLSTESE